MTSVKLTEATEGETIIIRVDGRVTMQTAHVLLTRLKDCVGRTHRILINLVKVDYMDSSGVGVLVTALKLSRDKGVRFGLVGLNERVCVVMEMSGLTALFEIFEDETKALAAMAG
ncbi:MAG: STAS domain-containing protein [Acidobacteriota bacterium]|nr:STAS domain-containing protein [Acidobacteriota bacterium]